jgi:hypothetical protein
MTNKENIDKIREAVAQKLYQTFLQGLGEGPPNFAHWDEECRTVRYWNSEADQLLSKLDELGVVVLDSRKLPLKDMGKAKLSRVVSIVTGTPKEG